MHGSQITKTAPARNDKLFSQELDELDSTIAELKGRQIVS